MAQEPAKPRTTIQDIAQATGLHHTTVSLALRNSPKLRPETRLKIQDAAKKLGYSPDPMFSALSMYRQAKRLGRRTAYQATLGWINNWPDRQGLIQLATFRKYYEGACDRAKQLGYVIEEFWLNEPKMSGSRTIGILKARNIQGVLLPPQPYSGAELPMDLQNLSVVAFGFSLQPPVHHVVANHHSHSVNLILRHLIELGYQRIGFCIHKVWDDRVENAWLIGFRVAHWQNSRLKNIPPCIIPSPQEERSLLAKWLEKHKPDVVVSSIAVAEVLKDLGYRSPEDIGFASLDVDEDNLSLSGINQNNFYTGQKAVDVLVGLLQRGETGIPAIPIRLLVESTWNMGATSRRQDPVS
jgi:DNA-binding LacI/PurR family transcriptional regulator